MKVSSLLFPKEPLAKMNNFMNSCRNTCAALPHTLACFNGDSSQVIYYLGPLVLKSGNCYLNSPSKSSIMSNFKTLNHQSLVHYLTGTKLGVKKLFVSTNMTIKDLFIHKSISIFLFKYNRIFLDTRDCFDKLISYLFV